MFFHFAFTVQIFLILLFIFSFNFHLANFNFLTEACDNALNIVLEFLYFICVSVFLFPVIQTQEFEETGIHIHLRNSEVLQKLQGTLTSLSMQMHSSRILS